VANPTRKCRSDWGSIWQTVVFCDSPYFSKLTQMSDKVPNQGVDRTKCDSEPIRFPGAIQPFGILLALDAGDLTLRHASENIRDICNSDAAALIGSSVAKLLGSAAELELRNGLSEDKLISHRLISTTIPGETPGRWHGRAHCMGGTVFVELEPTGEASLSSPDLLFGLRQLAGSLSAAATIKEFCSTLVTKVRSLTGFDRVMVYRFDTEWNGEVIAEDRRADLEAFLGLHYPATDIPSPAREVFLVNRMRVIPDVAYRPIPILPAADHQTGPQLDLSKCWLRSAAPVHLEYLANMGVGASMTCSLVVGGRLWGLIACHHLTPKCLVSAERDACELLAQMASVHLAFLAESEDRENLATLSNALWKLGATVSKTSPPIAAIATDKADLLALVGAEGVVVWRSGHGVSLGQTPPQAAIRGLVEWFKGVSAPILATDRLGQAYPPAKSFAKEASGLLALEVSRETDEYLLWFRPELLQSVEWGGDPNSKFEHQGRLSPRRSFALWKETVRERSLPWRPAEVENAKRVKELLLQAAVVSAVRLEALLPICAWCKNVRKEAGYWRAVEEFIHDLVDVRFTHGICPDCLQKQLAEDALHHPSPSGEKAG